MYYGAWLLNILISNSIRWHKFWLLCLLEVLVWVLQKYPPFYISLDESNMSNFIVYKRYEFI